MPCGFTVLNKTTPTTQPRTSTPHHIVYIVFRSPTVTPHPTPPSPTNSHLTSPNTPPANMPDVEVTPPIDPPTPPPTYTAQPTDPTDSTEGPLRTLVHKAAATPLVRRCRENVPAFASSAVSRTACTADAMLTKVDSKLTQAGKQLDTDEGKQLVAEATNLYNSLVTFVTVFTMAVVSFAEKALDVKYDADRTPPSGAERVCTVAKIACGKVRDVFDKRERQVEGTVEAEVYAKGRWFVGVLVAVSSCVLGALKDYSGPANEYVAPLAEKLLSVIPEQDDSAQNRPPAQSSGEKEE